MILYQGTPVKKYENGVYILMDHRESAPLATLPVPVSLLSEVSRLTDGHHLGVCCFYRARSFLRMV